MDGTVEYHIVFSILQEVTAPLVEGRENARLTKGLRPQQSCPSTEEITHPSSFSVSLSSIRLKACAAGGIVNVVSCGVLLAYLLVGLLRLAAILCMRCGMVWCGSCYLLCLFVALSCCWRAISKQLYACVLPRCCRPGRCLLRAYPPGVNVYLRK